MNMSEFTKEIMESRKCPSNFTEMFRVFQIAQADTLATLKEFHRVCEDNDINYQVAFGSLLGLIRDGGQIPWDYDIDVFVPFNQKDELITALKKNLNPDYYFYCPEVDTLCRHFIMRVAPKKYRTELLHVDVFYYVGTSNNEKLRLEHIKKIKEVSRARYLKFVNVKEESLNSPRRFLSLFYQKIPYLFMSIDKLTNEYNALCNQYPLENSELYLEADMFADSNILSSSLMKETMLIKVDAGEFRVPVNYEKILENIYGNYMKIPPLEDRIKEIIHFYKRYRIFNK